VLTPERREDIIQVAESNGTYAITVTREIDGYYFTFVAEECDASQLPEVMLAEFIMLVSAMNAGVELTFLIMFYDIPEVLLSLQWIPSGYRRRSW
jgi:hypothetical protein